MTSDCATEIINYQPTQVIFPYSVSTHTKRHGDLRHALNGVFVRSAQRLQPFRDQSPAAPLVEIFLALGFISIIDLAA